MGITNQQALDCFASDDLIGIGMEADAIRRTVHPESVVTYTIDRALDVALSPEAALAAAALALSLGATSLHLHGTPASLTDLESLLTTLKQHYPGLRISGLTASEVLALTTTSTLTETLTRIRAAGLDSLASHAVIFDDTLRHAIAPTKCSTADWLAVHRAAHTLGLTSAATMIFGVGETMHQRVHHLELLHALQAETGGFTSFAPLAHPTHITTEPTAVEYLKTLAISRLYLDNIPNIEASWQTQGLKVLQMALRFGANDVGSVLLDEHNSKPGTATEEELRRVIREAGFQPVQRDALYRTMLLS
jgi:cyclic dehypoxanthinyl futalosine synthase